MLKIPTSALFRAGNGWAAFVVRDGKAAQTTIRIGQRNAIEAEVISGATEGDRSSSTRATQSRTALR